MEFSRFQATEAFSRLIQHVTVSQLTKIGAEQFHLVHTTISVVFQHVVPLLNWQFAGSWLASIGRVALRDAVRNLYERHAWDQTGNSFIDQRVGACVE